MAKRGKGKTATYLHSPAKKKAKKVKVKPRKPRKSWRNHAPTVRKATS